MSGPADPPQTSSLEEMCENAIRLLSAAPSQPARIRLRAGDTQVEMEWSRSSVAVAGPVTGAEARPAPENTAPDRPAVIPGLFHLRAPMVGTFYRSPSPGAPPFVDVGDIVEAGQSIGILEAMKLMNPIEAEHPGRIVEILIPDATPVEYDQPLIVCAPLGGV